MKWQKFEPGKTQLDPDKEFVVFINVIGMMKLVGDKEPTQPGG